MDTIERLLKAFELNATEEQKERLYAYFSYLEQWNRSMNLTGLKDRDQMIYKHLGDSLLLLGYLPKNAKNLMDIGTGPGVPGLLIKIMQPEMQVTLVESVKKKCSFLKFVISKLRLSGTHVEQLRLSPEEPPGSMPEGGFDLAVSQATGTLQWLTEIAAPFVSERGGIIALKGPDIDQELAELTKMAASASQGGLKLEIKRDKLPLTGAARNIVFMRLERGQGR